jgi:hypothetical protein
MLPASTIRGRRIVRVPDCGSELAATASEKPLCSLLEERHGFAGEDARTA